MPVLRAAQSAEELALLRGVVADQSDAATLAVYNDWLEDHDDPRAPFLRAFLAAFAAQEPLPPIPETIPPAWADVLGLSLRWRLRAEPERLRNLEPFFAEILRKATPAVRMLVGEVAALEAFPLGVTRLGGLPDLPVGMSWPVPPDETDPMVFAFQLDLTDLRGTLVEGLLPDAGHLLFFLPGNHWRGVIYVPPGTPLERVPFPGGSNAEWDYVPPRSALLADALRNRMHWSEVPPESYLYLLTDEPRYRHVPEHWLATRLEASEGFVNWLYAADERPSSVFLELANLDEDPDLGWGFHDGDDLHVIVPLEDAQAGRFTRVRMYDAT